VNIHNSYIIPQTFTVTSSIGCFYFLVFLFYILVVPVRYIKLTYGSVPKIIINNTINKFILTAISIMVISNHDRFKVLYDKISSV